MIFGRKTYPIGLDLGSQCIKMVQFESTKAGVRAAAAGRYSFPADADINSPQRRELAIHQVRKLLKENGFRGRKVISALPDSQIAVSIVRLSQTSQAEIERAVWFEAAEKLPFDIQSAQLQYLCAGHIRQAEEIQNEVIVLAAQLQDIQEHIELLSAMGLEPVAIDAGPCALFRGFERFLLRREDEHAVSFIVDIGASCTKVVISHGAELAFVKIIKLGSRDMAQAVAKELRVSLTEAVKLRRRTASAPANAQNQTIDHSEEELVEAVFQASRSVLSELGREISLCLRYHGVTFRGYRPGVVRFTGGESHSQLTVDFLSKALALPVQPGDPFRYTNTSEIDLKSNRRKPAPSWAVSTGLALRGLIKGKSTIGDAA